MLEILDGRNFLLRFRHYGSPIAIIAVCQPFLPSLRIRPIQQPCSFEIWESEQIYQKFAVPRDGIYTVADFMTKKADLLVVQTSTTVDKALEILVEKRITGFPVVDADWNLVGVVSDYDLLALDSISGGNHADTVLFPDVDSSWKTFNEIQKLLGKTDGKVVGDLMTPAPLVVHETSNLEEAVRLLLETKHRRLPVVNDDGKLVGLITRGDVVRAALQIKHAIKKMQLSKD
ncbi:hypothetical protein E3N88_27839 [Mikania micrantha]|uniref:CBS domain-containing protein n=1 Tax=Mikania micrantha TaxID=192012 RepID=A0A5N6MXW5_9ASTR|nr:hypothetical protein E3N88_27839 [Mikania micrantha]